MFNKFNWDWNAQNINLFRIIGPGPVLLLTSFSSNPGKAFALKGNLSLWCSDPSWDSQLTSGSINIWWGVLSLIRHDFVYIFIIYLWLLILTYLLSSQMLSMSPHKIVGCSTKEKNFSRFQMNLLTVWDWAGELLNSVDSYLIGENEAYKISILVFFCIYKQGAREIQSAKRDLAKHQYRIRILCLYYLAPLQKNVSIF